MNPFWLDIIGHIGCVSSALGMFLRANPFWLDIVGHVGYVFIALGMFLLARQNILGWVSRFVGEFIWLVIGVHMGMSSIWSWGLLFLFMEIYGFRTWKRALQKQEAA